MIDALELAIPSDWELAPRWRFIPKLLDVEKTDCPMKTHRTTDLRRFGIKATMHSHRGHGRLYDKLAFRSTGSTHYLEMQNVLENLFDRDPANLRVSRIDLAVDLENIAVDFFYRNVIASKKHFSREFGKYSPSGVIAIETIYMGRRPNCFRIYSRTAKLAARGIPDSPFCEIVRIEREIGGTGVPESIKTLGMIPNTVSFDPFSSLKIVIVRDFDSRPRTVMQWLARHGLRELIRERGAQQTIRILNRNSNGNASRIRRTLGVTESSIIERIPDLYERYCQSLGRQLGPVLPDPSDIDKPKSLDQGERRHG